MYVSVYTTLYAYVSVCVYPVHLYAPLCASPGMSVYVGLSVAPLLLSFCVHMTTCGPMSLLSAFSSSLPAPAPSPAGLLLAANLTCVACLEVSGTEL